MRRSLSIIGIAALAMLSVTAAFTAEGSSSAADLARRAVRALNERKAADFAALAASGVDTSWVKNATAAPDPAGRRWVGRDLQVGDETWVVLSLDKMVEMDHDHLYRAERRGGRWRLAAVIEEAEPGRHWRITGHDQTLVLDPARRSGRFEDVFRVRPVGEPRPLVFDLGHEYQIGRLTVNGSPAPYTRAGNLVRVDRPVPAGAALRIAYRRTFRHPPSFLSNVSAQDALLYADWLPVISYQPAPARITLDTPAAWESLAQGELTRTVRAGGRVRRTFTNRAPVSFIMAAAGKYRVTRRNVHGYPVATYMVRYDRAKSEIGLSTLAFAMPFYVERFGPIPWKQYSLVETTALQNLAQEGYSYSVYSSSLFPGVAAHELAHSWWGGLVNNTYFGSYWNESVTTYSTDLVMAAQRGETMARANRMAEMRRYRTSIEGRHDVALMDASKTPWGPVTLGTTYQKGAMVVHMLHRELGDELFTKTLRQFAKSFAGKAAEWSDLAGVATLTAGRPMGWFFDQWTRRPGGLRLRWENVRARDLGTGSTEVTATLRQEPPLYVATVPVAVDSALGRVSTSVRVSEERTPVRLTVPGRPQRLVADPDDDLLRYLELEEIPPNTDAMFYGHHPLLVVYGTGGDAAYQKAMREQAEAQATFWRESNDGVAADLESIRVVADRDVTEPDRRRSHLILMGRPGANGVVDAALRSLPVRWEGDGSVTLDGQRYSGKDLVTVANVRSPWNRDRLLRVWSGSSPAAMSLGWDESGGGVFALLNAAWVAERGRLLAWSDAGIRDRRTFAFRE
jgi:hypothetical protein